MEGGRPGIANEQSANETNSNWDKLQMNEVSGSGQGSAPEVCEKCARSAWEVHGDVWEVQGKRWWKLFWKWLGSCKVFRFHFNLTPLVKLERNWARPNASAGNRTRVISMATMYSTTRPLMP